MAEASGRSQRSEALGPAADIADAATPDRNAALASGQLILVAEDNPTNQMVIMRQLARLGYAADLAADGGRALDLFSAASYGLVITDVHMPKMDGLELAAAIRELERNGDRRRVPIVALTANVLGGEAERCLAAGMDDYLGKPVALAQLQEALARWLIRAMRAEPTPARPPPVAAAKILNLERMQEIIGTIDADAVALLHRYVESTALLLTEIDRMVAARRADDALEAAHAAKGASLSAGAEELAALCADLETAMEVAAWDDAAALQVRLGPAFARVRDAVLRLEA